MPYTSDPRGRCVARLFIFVEDSMDSMSGRRGLDRQEVA